MFVEQCGLKGGGAFEYAFEFSCAAKCVKWKRQNESDEWNCQTAIGELRGEGPGGRGGLAASLSVCLSVPPALCTSSARNGRMVRCVGGRMVA